MEPTEEQLQNRQTALENIRAGRPQDEGISSADLSTGGEIDVSEPGEIPLPDISGIDTELTEPEQEASDVISQIRDLNQQTVGESQFRARKEQELGVPELQKTQRDLQAQVKALQNEARAIPLQVQEESTARGRTRAGVEPIETARLRRNAIKALSVSSLLEATKGNLNTALDQVDRAVEQKYEPIKEEIRAKKANLQLILQSPEFSVEQKRRARRQERLQEQRENEVAQQEAEDKAIGQVAVEAARLGADAQTLRRIQNAESEVEATRIAQEAGFVEEAKNTFATQEVDGQLVEFEMNQQGRIVGQRVIAGTREGVSDDEEGIEQLSPEARMVVENPALLEQYTPTERGRLLNEIARSGGVAETVAQKSTQNMVTRAQDAVEDLRGESTLFNTALQTLSFGFLGKEQDSAVERLTGVTGFASPFNPFGLVIPGTAGANVQAKLETLKSRLTLPNLEFARGLGRMNQKQFETLRNASQSLETRMSDDAFVRELDRIEEVLLEMQAESEGRGRDSLEFGDDEYQRFLQSINEVELTQ